MKKLMIAAAVAAMTAGAFADEKPCVTCAYGYKIQLVAKTLTTGNVSNKSEKVCGCYRKPTMGKLVGYVLGQTTDSTIAGPCGDESGCGCNAWDAAEIYLWKAWNKRAYDAGNLKLEAKIIDRFGGAKDRSGVEALFGLTGTNDSLALAGFGKAGYRADGTVAVKNLNGFFAGYLACLCTQKGAVNPCGDDDPDTIEPSLVFEICTGAEVESSTAVAYGKWQMIWDSQLVERVTKNGLSPDTVRPSRAYEMQYKAL